MSRRDPHHVEQGQTWGGGRDYARGYRDGARSVSGGGGGAPPSKGCRLFGLAVIAAASASILLTAAVAVGIGYLIYGATA